MAAGEGDPWYRDGADVAAVRAVPLDPDGVITLVGHDSGIPPQDLQPAGGPPAEARPDEMPSGAHGQGEPVLRAAEHAYRPDHADADPDHADHADDANADHYGPPGTVDLGVPGRERSV
jgi:hypothetical protein